jgi:preprotein translocase subunit SecD
VRRSVGAMLLGLTVATAIAMALPAEARAGKQLHLQFRPVLGQLPSSGSTTATTATTTAASGAAARAAVASCDLAAVTALPVVPTSNRADKQAGACVVLPESPGGKRVARYYLGPAGLDEGSLARARAEFVSGQGWTIRLDLTKAGSATWDALAQAQFHQQVALVVDGLVLSAPTIQPSDQTFSSFGGIAVISGRFTAKSAKSLAAGLQRTIAADGR